MNKFLKLFFSAALFFSLILGVKAAGVDTRGSATVTFPVAELGNCGNKQECKTYCDKAENISACANFSQSHGLITQQQKQQAENLSSALKQGSGPGGCTDAASCKTYCSDTSHVEECVAFAREHNLASKEKLDSAKKIGQALKQGAGPGGCKNENDCKQLCSKAENQPVCLDFAKKQGLVSEEDAATLDKFAQAVKDGQTPGGCATKDECKTYCQDQSHKEACLQFLVKIGGIKPEQAEKIKASGGKGPGGCDSQDACQTYCNNEDRHEECLNFAKEHGLVKKGDAENIQQGEAGLKVGVKNLPPEVKKCLEENLDGDTISKIESGQFSPTAQVGSKVKECLEKFKPQIKEQLQSKFQADPASENCVKQAIGQDALIQLKDGQVPADPDLSKKIRPCFENKTQDHSNSNPAPHPIPASDLKNCLVKILGQDAVDNLDTSKLNEDAKAAIQKCRPEGQSEEHKQAGAPSPASRPVPADIKECLAKVLGESAAANFSTQNLTEEQKAAIAKCLPQNHNPGQDGRPAVPFKPIQPQAGDSNKIKDCLVAKLGEDGFKKLSDPAQRNSADIQAILKDCGYPIAGQPATGQGVNLPKPSSGSGAPPVPQAQPTSTSQEALLKCKTSILGDKPTSSATPEQQAQLMDCVKAAMPGTNQPNTLPLNRQPSPTGAGPQVKGASTTASPLQRLMYFLGIK